MTMRTRSFSSSSIRIDFDSERYRLLLPLLFFDKTDCLGASRLRRPRGCAEPGRSLIDFFMDFDRCGELRKSEL